MVDPLDDALTRPLAARAITRRRPLPNGRAVAGGFLIAVAAVLTFAAYGRAGRGPSARYVVAARALAPGDHLTSDDLALVAVGAPASVRHHLFGAVGDLVGAATLAPIAAGALIQSSEVGAPSTALELSFSIDRSRALGGKLRPGEHVDVLGTFGTGATSYTAVMAAHVLVLAITPSGDTDLIAVAVPDAATAEAVADAASAVAVTLVRSLAAAGPTPPPYHPPPDR